MNLAFRIQLLELLIPKVIFFYSIYEVESTNISISKIIEPVTTAFIKITFLTPKYIFSMLLTRLRVGVTNTMLIGSDTLNPGVILTRVRYPAPEIDDGCFCFHFELFISLLVFLRFESDIYTDTIVTFSLFFLAHQMHHTTGTDTLYRTSAPSGDGKCYSMIFSRG